MTTAQVLERLSDGPKTYSQLKGLCGNLDFVIGKLLRSKEIVFTPNGARAAYSLPKSAVVKEVLMPREYRPEVRIGDYYAPDEPTKTCTRCKEVRRINQFGRSRKGGNRKNVCYMCVYERKKYAKEHGERPCQ